MAKGTRGANGPTCQGCGSPIRMGKYCVANPECNKRRSADYYAKHKEQLRAAMRRWYAANRERNAEIGARWRAANPEKARAITARYKSRTDRPCVWPRCETFAAQGKPFCLPHHAEDQARRYARRRAKLARDLFTRQQGLCPDAGHGGCGLPLGAPDGHHVDHLIPRSIGGPDKDWNLQLMHQSCNGIKRARVVPAAVALAAERGVILGR